MQTLQVLTYCDLCYLFEGAEIEAKTYQVVIDGEIRQLDLDPLHAKMEFDDVIELFREHGVRVPDTTPGTFTLPQNGSGVKTTMVRKGTKIGKLKPQRAHCPVEGCTRDDLEGEEGETDSRGVIQHVRQTSDEAHTKAYANFRQYRSWQ